MRLEPVERLNLTLSAGAIAASFALATPHFASSLALGAALEAFNFGALNRSARALFGGVIVGGGPWVAVFATRFVFLAAGIILSLYAGADAIGLVIGLSIAMPATLIMAWIDRPAVEDPDTLPALDADDPAWDRWSVWRVREVDVDPDAEEEIE